MSGINKVILIGNLGQDPELRQLPSGDAVANLTLATSERWKDKTGQPQERTEWHRLALFGRVAEIAGQFLGKGSRIYVEGRLRTRKWTTSDGHDRYTTEVVVDQRGVMQMLDSRQSNGDIPIAEQPPWDSPKPPTASAARPEPVDIDFDADIAPF